MYFIALVCPDEVNKRVVQYKHWMKEHFGCVVALRSPAHITLIPPLWVERSQEPLLVDTLHSFKGRSQSLQIDIDGFSHFDKRVLFAAVRKNDSLTQLKEDVEAHFMKSFSSIQKEERAFHPHITIANRDLKPADFVKAWQHFSQITFKVSFPANALSILKHVGGKWEIIAQKKW